MKVHQTMICLTPQVNIVKILEELPHLLDEYILLKLFLSELCVPDVEQVVGGAV